MRVAAVQLEPVLADVPANLEACLGLADQAGADGAEWIVLPEFFTTGVAFAPELAGAALAPDGAATQLMLDLARRHGATVGGSFLCRDDDGHVRNAFLLVSADGVLGRHDKDLPTMWENCFYVEGADDGVIDAGELQVGVALCWELMRTQTARRLRERVDLVVGGSCWWSVPPSPPVGVSRRLEAANARAAANVTPAFARLVGAPVVHAAHCGRIACEMPWSPLPYRGHYEGAAMIADADGHVLTSRAPREGAGYVIADVTPGRSTSRDALPDRFWLHPRGAVGAFSWSYQRMHGRRWYRRHTFGRPPLEVEQPASSAAA